MDEQQITLSPADASSLRALAVREYNRKIKRNTPRGLRPSEWALALEIEATLLRDLGHALDAATPLLAPPQAIE